MMSLTQGNSEYVKLTITGTRDEAPQVKTFFLAADQEIVYRAGQFLTLIFENIVGEEERRSYSISSSPALNERLAITLKRVYNGRYSRPLIDHARAGDVLLSTPATGQFTLPENIGLYKQIFFFAAGIGITPVYSLIKTILHRYLEIDVILIYSNPSVMQTVFYSELLKLHQSFKQFHCEFLFSSSSDLSRARLSKWLLPQLLNIYSKGTKDEQLFYTCGPFAYMRMVLLALEELGYSKDQVRRELFDTTRPVLKLEPPDKDPHQVTIEMNGATHLFSAQYPKTILQAAKANSIVLPYSCETGKCGSCTAQRVKGKVWMSYNEVLTDKDLEEGKILTCVGFPVGGDVVLRF